MTRSRLAVSVACLLAVTLGFAARSAASSPAVELVGSPVIAAAGDIACKPGVPRRAATCHHANVANLLAGADRVLPLGDIQYESGTAAQFAGSYDLSWGAYKSVTSPIPGNHEYKTPGAAGYYSYFNNPPAYYSYDLGDWHLIALNSQVPTAEGSAQNNWLENDLAANPAQCTLAYMHFPRYTAGEYAPGFTKVKPLWVDLLKARADVVLAGHDHSYQRWAQMNNAGAASATGIRSFVVGTGGKSHYPLTVANPLLQASDVQNFGVLRMTLEPGSYGWQFVGESEQILDSGTAACV